ncbi:MAG TPA: sulfatase-like hydrolase/transferase, partial [Membranihabitans sp.]|nr:sulfatase-like hydrolase/transferase [Membranihabitans sp.]
MWITSEDNSKHYLSLFDPNGVETPHIEALARHGLQFTRAFSNAPVCSVARSTLITGAYAPRIGAQYHRKLQTVPMPQDLKMFPEYLREAGYYTTNNPKEDYNLEKSASVWDESSREASWKNRAPGQPFFHMVNIGVTHEGNLHFSRDFIDTLTLVTDERNVFVQPNHPNTEIFRRTNAYYRDRIRLMDKMVGEIVAELEDEGLMDNTFIFYFGDHGGVLPGSKGYLYETGLHVPLVVYVPPMYRDLWGIQAGEKVQGFVSFIDFAPTVLSIAGVEI